MHKCSKSFWYSSAFFLTFVSSLSTCFLGPDPTLNPPLIISLMIINEPIKNLGIEQNITAAANCLG